VWVAALLVVPIAVAMLPSAAPAADKFPKPCTPPFNGDWKKQSIDKKCPPEGKVSQSGSAEKIARHEAQNRLKSDICPEGTAKSATFQTFDELQQGLDSQGIDYGSSSKLPDRPIQPGFTTDVGSLHEGDEVVLEGYLQHAKKSGKESCNCGYSTEKDTDIHIHLVEATNDAPCQSVVVEMSPHYRPPEWRALTLDHMKTWYVRVTGQLFIDAAHKPCQGGRALGGHPARRSVWEIHPVYKFEVCVYDECDDPDAWYTVKQWVSEYE
jgi:hypothetical protein